MSHASPRDQLKLHPEEMREMGYRIIDMLVDYTGAQAQFPVTRALDHATFEEILDEPLPETGSDWQDVFGTVRATGADNHRPPGSSALLRL